MAGDWIKMRGNLWDDPRIAKLCDLTDQGEAAIVGALYWLWAMADQHTENGHLPGLTLRQIDRKTGVQGFAQAMCDIEWLQDDPDGVTILNFTDHNGESAKRRSSDAKRKAAVRNVSAEERTNDGNLADNSGDFAELEKRREEKREIPEANASGGAKRGARKCPESFAVTDNLREWALRDAPGVDIERETAKFRDHTFKDSRTDWAGAWRNWIRKAFESLPKARGSPVETAYQRSMRSRVEEFAPGLSAKPGNPNVIDMEPPNVLSLAGR